MVRLLLVMGVVACDSGKPAPPPAPPVVPPPAIDAAVADAIEIDAMSNHDLMVQAMKPLKDLQAKLGDKASTCAGVAEILAWQVRNRVAVSKITKLCTDDRWNRDMRDCVAMADHDPLSCSQYLKGRASTRFDDALLGP